jgi:hypothetical protein
VALKRGALLRQIIAISTTFVGCHRVQTSYEPSTAVQPAGSTAYRAAQFYENDFRYILESEGRPIGYIEARGDGSTTFSDVDDAALKEAAARGGTHVVRTNKDLESVYFQIARAKSDTNCTTAETRTDCATTFTDATFAKIAALPRARYSIWRVPCQNWPRLPEQLRPVTYVGCTAEVAAPEDGHLAESTISPVTKDGPEDSDQAALSNADFINTACAPDVVNTQLPFERDLAARAVREGATKSLSCRWATGIGVTLEFTFGPAGCLRQVHVRERIQDFNFKSCLVAAFSDARVPAFAGGPVTISKHLGAAAK